MNTTFIKPFIILFFLLPLCVMARSEEPGTSKTTSPFHFVENKGQITDQYHKQRKDIDFKINTPGFDVFIGGGQIHYQWKREQYSLLQLDKLNAENLIKTEFYRLDVSLVGVNSKAEVIREKEQDYFERYYLPYCEKGTVAHSFDKITYKNVYPNIDWVIYLSESGLKYDFIVHPGGNAGDIALKYDGATSLGVYDGAVTATTPFGNLTEKKPYSYLQSANTEVRSSFNLTNNILRFNVNNIEGHETLVIDPTLLWSTYYGLNDGALSNSVAINAAGAGFISGYTTNSTNIATFGAHQYSYAGSTDGYVAKISADGTARAWGSYFGGTNYDVVLSMTCDTSGHVYVAGQTMSTSGIAYGTYIHHPANGGTGTGGTSLVDAFLAKFDGSGGSIHWSTFYGGKDVDAPRHISCDVKNNVYLAGITASDTGMATSGTFQTSPGAGFVAKFNTSGVRQWGTYYGGDINAVTTDTAGNVYIGGSAPTSLLISTSGSHQPGYGGGTQDAYIAKLSISGTRLWGTYYGGKDYEEALALACDQLGNLYAGGRTWSDTGLATSGAFRTVYNPPPPPAPQMSDAFLVKFSPSGMRQWGTYYGADSGPDYINSIVITHDSRNIYLAGCSGNTTGIAMAGGHKTTYSGGWMATAGGEGDGFLVKFNHLGIRKYGTYYGDTASESGVKIAYANGKLAFGGTTGSGQGIATTGAYQQAPPPPPPPPPPGSPPPFPICGFLSIWNADTNVYFNQAFTDTNVCQGDVYSISCKVTNKFKANNVFTVQLSNASGSFASPTTVGTLADSVGGFIPYTIPLIATPGAGYRLRVVASSPTDTALDNGRNIRISAYAVPRAFADSPVCVGGPLNLYDTSSSAATDYIWYGPTNTIVGIGQNIMIPNMPSTSTGRYVLEIKNYACIVRDTVYVTVLPNPDTLALTSNSPVCTGDTLKIVAITVTPGVYYIWLTPHTPPNYYPQAPGTYADSNMTFTDTGWYKVAAVLNGCISRQDSVHILANQTVIPTISMNTAPGPAVFPGTTINFSSTMTNGGTTPTYQWYKNGNPIPGATAPIFSGKMGTDFNHKDSICVEMISVAICPKPPFVRSCVEVIDESINVRDVHLHNIFRLYPNPNDGNFTIAFAESPKGKVQLEVINAIGQTVYTKDTEVRTNNIVLHLPELANGVHLLRLRTENSSGNIRFTVDK